MRFAAARAELLTDAIREFGSLKEPVADLAGWISHIDPSNDVWHWTLAGIIDAGGPDGQRVLDTLTATIRGEHETGEMHPTVVKALLCCNRPEAWECIATLLLAAQREEGLRQSILESLIESHPGAFARLCRTILDHDLCRFSSVVRAANGWFGLLWDSASVKVVEEAIECALRFLQSPADREPAIQNGHHTDAYFALWAAGFEDFHELLVLAEKALKHREPLIRYAGVHALVSLDLDELAPTLLKAIDDSDLRVAVRAIEHFTSWSREEGGQAENETSDETFNAAERLLARFPDKRTKIKPTLWPWTARDFDSAVVGSVLVRVSTPHTIDRLISHLPRLNVRDREKLATSLGGRTHDMNYSDRWSNTKPGDITETARGALIGLLGDPGASVVVHALLSLYNRPIESDERAALAAILKRRSFEMRTAALYRVVQLTDDRLLDFARELLESKSAQQRLAALEILKIMCQGNRSPELAREAAAECAAGVRNFTTAEQEALKALAKIDLKIPHRNDAFGLINPTNLTKPTPTRALPMLKMSEAAWHCLAAIARIIAENKSRELPKEISSDPSDDTILLGDDAISYQAARPSGSRSLEEDRQRCGIADLVQAWLDFRDHRTRDVDGLELLRADLGLETYQTYNTSFSYVGRPMWPASIATALKTNPDALDVTTHAIEYFLAWTMRLAGNPGYADAILDSLEGAVCAEAFQVSEDVEDDEQVSDMPLAASKPLCGFARGWLCCLGELQQHGVIDPDPRHSIRVWQLAIAAREPALRRWTALDPKTRQRLSSDNAVDIAFSPSSSSILDAFSLGAATEDDLLDFATHSYWSESGNVEMLVRLPGLDELAAESPGWKREEALLFRRASTNPVFVSASNRLRERIVELELARGDAPTEASKMAKDLYYAGGADVCLRCMVALGNRGLKRKLGWSDESREGVISHFVSITTPDDRNPADAPKEFAAQALKLKFEEETLIALAVFAPQWVRHVEQVLGKSWAGIDDAVYWIHAHTKDNVYSANSTLRSKTHAAIDERTPLRADELGDGAVDVAWFTRIIDTLGEAKWSRIYELAKFACSGTGHKRAQIFADAMLSRRGASERELMARIKSKRHQDSIRALGLVPLKTGKANAKARQTQVLTRYKLMQEIRRTSRKHGGSMLQASEKRAVEVGMDNLARSAGYPDPLRLQWAMERFDLADLVKGPVPVKVGDVTVTLSVTDHGSPELSAAKKGKPLASIPAVIKKDKKVAELSARFTDIRRSAPRMRQALEQAMCRGDVFTSAELADLWAHPLLRTMLQRLVLVGDTNHSLAGYSDKGGKVLRDHAGKLEPLKGSDTLRIAHPHDLLKRKDWSKWQRECFTAERVQPFKQVFREVYVPTAAETGRATESKRYEGHQIQPRQAMALLSARSWFTRSDQGVQRTFYKERLTARLEFAEHFYTPAEVEGLTLRALVFTLAGKHDPIKLSDVPPRVLSEIMRDLDLVVSVAHRGGVDPEASQSTVELRAALARETADLLKLSNIAIEGARIMIKGALADYALHLASGSIHILPGGQVWVVPIASEHRGRLFLPFADSDPKSAEVISKLLLLARDKEIKDPSILAQIRALT